jgi:hypothetical protein
MGGAMSSVTISGDTSGSIILQAPAVSGSTTLTLPTTSGTIVTNTAGTVTQTMLTTGVAGNGPAFYANRTGAQALSSGILTKIQMNNEIFDTNNNYDPTTNYRFTPTVAGYYQISGSVMFTNNVNNVGAYTSIAKNGTSAACVSSTANSGMYSGACASILLYLNGTTDYVELFASSQNGAYSVNGGAFVVGDSTFFSAFLARAA